jgi:hypothetical protein
MIKGHLDQSRKNQDSTKPMPKSTPVFTELTPKPTSEPDDNIVPPSPMPNKHTHFCYAVIMEPTGQVYTDQTGRFVTPSSHGNNYLLICYDYDSNSILAKPIKNCTGAAILHGYKTIHSKLCTTGLKPRLEECLDNKCAEPLKQFLCQEDIDFQLAPPGIHCRIATECAIRMFKNPFITWYPKLYSSST